MYNKINKYFSKHVMYNSAVHAIGGAGIGILIAQPLANPHPVRWAIVLIIISLLGHWYALMGKK